MEVSRLTASKIADLNKILVTECNKPSLRIPRSISFDAELLERLDAQCKALNVDRSEVIRRLVRLWLQDPAEAKEPQEEPQQTPSNDNPPAHKYLNDLKSQWSQLSPDQKAKHQAYVIRTYGTLGQSFLAELGDSKH